ncbi:hypothetical protein PspR76_13260 [Pseudomonas sp. R76]|nr:hypothetical protein PspR76_13260 [Pseudomonas sp. R76]
MHGQACVGAGLPAMQTPRCISDTEPMLSQASQLPHLIDPRLKTLPALGQPLKQPFSNRNKLLLYRS